MPSQDDILFGQIAVKRHLATAEQIKECLKVQERETATGKGRRTLGQILAAHGYITAIQVDLVLEQQRQMKSPKMIGQYQLISKLGEGGMGAVYLARLPTTGLEVALKVLSAKVAGDRSFLGRFKREAEVGLKFDHPNIIHTFDVGADKGVHFMALELVEGGDLEARVKSGPLPESEALRIIGEICGALQYAHEHGIVHRDIKPTNIMFDKEGTPKLGDLGLVKSTEGAGGDLTQAGMLVGTPQYISPEQARGERDIDIRSDIYSLGATFYRICAGEVPFTGGSPLEVIAKRLTTELVSPRQLNPKLSAGATAIITKMMARDRADRYAQPSDVLHDIELVKRGSKPERAAIAAGKSSVLLEAAVGPPEPPPVQRFQDSTIKKGLGIGVALLVVLGLVLLITSPAKKAESAAPPDPSRTPLPIAAEARPPAQTTAALPPGLALPNHAPENTPAVAAVTAPGQETNVLSSPGVIARGYDMNVPDLPRFFDTSHAVLISTKCLDTIDIHGNASLKELFGRDSKLLVEFTGSVYMPQSGECAWTLNFEGLARFFIDGREQLRETHRSVAGVSSKVHLREGWHPFFLQYAPIASDSCLTLIASIANLPSKVVPASAFRHARTVESDLPISITTELDVQTQPLKAALRSLGEAFHKVLTCDVEDGHCYDLNLELRGPIDMARLVSSFPELGRLALRNILPGQEPIRLDLGPLAATGISALDLDGIETDLFALKNSRVASLTIRNLKALNLAPVSAIDKLGRLIISRVNVESLEPIKNCKLWALHCDYCPISDIKPLENMPLSELTITATHVKDLKPLENLPLRELNISFTPVKDLSPLRKLTNLMHLTCDGLEVSDLGPLASCTSLAALTLRGVHADLAPLAKSNLTDIAFEEGRAFSPAELQLLRNMAKLHTINGRLASDFLASKQPPNTPNVRGPAR